MLVMNVCVREDVGEKEKLEGMNGRLWYYTKPPAALNVVRYLTGSEHRMNLGARVRG